MSDSLRCRCGWTGSAREALLRGGRVLCPQCRRVLRKTGMLGPGDGVTKGKE